MENYNRLSRRQFLADLLKAGGISLLPTVSLLGYSDKEANSRENIVQEVIVSDKDGKPHYFIFYYMIGGWDLTLLTEPYSHNSKFADVSYRDDQIVEIGSHRFGPAMKYLMPWMDRTSIIRGIKMTALNHPQARMLLHTGQFKKPNQRPAPSIQTRIANRFKERYVLPNLSSDGLRPASFLGGMLEDLKPMRINSISQYHELLKINSSVDPYKKEIFSALEQLDGLASQNIRGSDLAESFEVYANLSRTISSSDSLQKTARGKQSQDLYMRGINLDSRWGRQANLAVEAVKNDLAPTITVGSGEFDSHTKGEYLKHPRMVKRGMQTVSLICEGLEAEKLPNGGTLLDRTTIVVGSEFSRTPHINELGGKHHWETNSLMIIGKGVKRLAGGGPNVFGDTTETMHPVKINPMNGSKNKDADDLLINNALATILLIAGIDPIAAIDAEPIPDLVG